MARDERVLKKEDTIYHSGHGKFFYPMKGRLVVSNRRLAFLEYQVVKRGALFGSKETREILRMNVPAESILGGEVEVRSRKRGTIADPPGLLNREDYAVLVVSLEAGGGVQRPAFEVADAEAWRATIDNVMRSHPL